MWQAQIAQSVEQRTENPRVTGSIPVLGIVLLESLIYGPLAQVVEHLTFNQVVPGSSPGWLTNQDSRKVLIVQAFREFCNSKEIVEKGGV